MSSIPLTAQLIWAGVFGAVLGSFLNVVAVRFAAGTDASGRSACPTCNHQLSWSENVPILGWLALGGRCLHCRTPINIRYPVVEALNALLWVMLWWHIPPQTPPEALLTGLQLLTGSALLTITLTDLDTGRIPNRVTLPAGVMTAGLIALTSLAGQNETAHGALIGAAVYTAPILVFALVGAMGFGDAKIAPVIGASLGAIGMPTLVMGMVAPYLLAFPAALLTLRRGGRGSTLPLGPALAGGWLLALFFGKQAASLFGVDILLAQL
ncbi:prepilin peptidase [Pseudoclavibacter soli]|uniref:prepilin peptidase n=1 Tax=Pseudoclavibacter soli TaxID=452623 RepID=UPI0004253C46|nr:A24 family peptidase [Pseudoclavibacter soli]